MPLVRLDRIRRLLDGEAGTSTLAQAATQLCERSSVEAIRLRVTAMERLHKALKVDRSPLFKKNSRQIDPSQIPAHSHLRALQRVTRLVLKEVISSAEAADKSLRLLRLRLEKERANQKQLDFDQAAYVNSFADCTDDSLSPSTTAMLKSRATFNRHIAELARSQWPKRDQLRVTLERVASLERELRSVQSQGRAYTYTPERLRVRLRRIGSLLVAVKEARRKHRRKQEQARRRLAKAYEAATRYAEIQAEIKNEEDARQRAESDRLREMLDRENELVRSTARKVVAGTPLLRVIADLSAQGVADPTRIAYQATIYAKNVLLAGSSDGGA